MQSVRVYAKGAVVYAANMQGALSMRGELVYAGGAYAGNAFICEVYLHMLLICREFLYM